MEASEAISALLVKGFKSFAEERRLEIRPLTLLAGANSSGKSSALQPLLLLKQTLEHSFDPGPLLLDGPHVRFTSANQLLTHVAGQRVAEEFEVAVEVGGNRGLRDVFRRRSDERLDLVRMTEYGRPGDPITLEPAMDSDELKRRLPLADFWGDRKVGPWRVARNRCFLGVVQDGALNFPTMPSTFPFDHALRWMIHVPGLRGNPARTYGTTDFGEYFAGTFENYSASVIALWQKTEDGRLAQLSDALCRLGLTWKIPR